MNQTVSEFNLEPIQNDSKIIISIIQDKSGILIRKQVRYQSLIWNRKLNENKWQVVWRQSRNYTY